MKSVTNCIFSLFLIAFANLNCKGQEPVIKSPGHGHVTEFHRAPKPWMAQIYMNYGYRGINRESERSFLNSIGGGLGVFIHMPMSPQWIGHKSLYYYMDFDVSPEYSGNPYPGSKDYVYSGYPGIYIRQYLPFLFKLYYGGGVALRYSQTAYDRWGMYGQIGVELCGLTSSIIVIGHPGQNNWESEYRFGYMLYRPWIKCFGE